VFQEEEDRYRGNLLMQHPRVQSEQVGKALRLATEAADPRKQLLAGPQPESPACC